MAEFSNQNTRVYYAIQALALGTMGASAVRDSWGRGDSQIPSGAGGANDSVFIMHGVQNGNITTNFNLEPIFEWGQSSLYENVEDVPDIEMTIERYLDGYTLAYHASTPKALAPTLAGRADSRTDARIIIGVVTNDTISSGEFGVAELYNSGMYVSSLSLNLVSDGVFSENVTLVGNNKKWIRDTTHTQNLLISSGAIINPAFTVFGNDSPQSPDSGVLRRENIITGSGGATHNATVFRTVLPSFIQGVQAGANAVGSGGSVNCGVLNTDRVHVQSATISVDLGREAINQLGSKGPYSRYVNFPVEVTTELEVIAIGGDNVDAVETNNSNLLNHTLQFVLDDSTIIQLGHKNKINTVTWNGAAAGQGDNASITYSMSNYNDLVVLHSGDPALLGIGAANYWKDHFI